MDKLVRYAPALAIAIVAIGLAGYAVALALAAFFPGALGGRGAQLADWFIASPAQNLGLPCAAIAAFAIVAALLKAFPPSTDARGQFELRAFGLEFSGPSGPITLWLMCFLGFVLALKLLRA
jgi:hypothetical protein